MSPEEKTTHLLILRWGALYFDMSMLTVGVAFNELHLLPYTSYTTHRHTWCRCPLISLSFSGQTFNLHSLLQQLHLYTVHLGHVKERIEKLMFIHGHDNIHENILSKLVSSIYSSSECFNVMVSVLSFHLWPENKWPRFNNKDLNLKRWLDTRDNHCLPLSLTDWLTWMMSL